MRFTEINLFGVYVAPMLSMMVCRLGGDDRTALVRDDYMNWRLFRSTATFSTKTHCRPSSPRQRLAGSAVKRTFTSDFYT